MISEKSPLDPCELSEVGSDTQWTHHPDHHDVSSAPEERGVAKEGNIAPRDDAGAVRKINIQFHYDSHQPSRIVSCRERDKTLTGKKSIITVLKTEQAVFLLMFDRKENH